jgi:hypothetical protein
MNLLGRDDSGTVWFLRPVDVRGLRVLLDPSAPGPRSARRASLGRPEVESRVLRDLEESLAAHQAAVRRVVAWFEDPAKCSRGKGGYALSLTHDDMELLLQALNDVRMGAWERLGRPDPPDAPDDLAPDSPALPDWWRMGVSGAWLSVLLQALEEG